MVVIDKGHLYRLESLDGSETQELRFVKRVGPGFPGNEAPPYAGTNIQEVLRVLINRVQYLDGQIATWHNKIIIACLKCAFNLLEQRAAGRHGVAYVWSWGVDEKSFGEDGHVV